jgi:predicted neuraminidase
MKYMKHIGGFIVGFLLIVSGLGSAQLRVDQIDTLPPQPHFDRYCATLVHLEDGALGCAWYGAAYQGQANLDPEVRHTIWYSRWQGSWSAPSEVTPEANLKCWNPVLYNQNGKLLLFYKLGRDPRSWIGLVKQSLDGGASWSSAAVLPAGIIGPTRNPPLPIGGGCLLCGSSWEGGDPTDPLAAAACWLEIGDAELKHWGKLGPFTKPSDPFGLIQPALFQDSTGTIHMLMRDRAARRGQIGWIWEAVSRDGGLIWTEPRRTNIPNPDLPIDICTLSNGWILLACNPVHTGRSPLVLFLSQDDGSTWQPLHALETEGDACYVAMVEESDRKIHLVYSTSAKAGQPRDLKHLIATLLD